MNRIKGYFTGRSRVLAGSVVLLLGAAWAAAAVSHGLPAAPRNAVTRQGVAVTGLAHLSAGAPVPATGGGKGVDASASTVNGVAQDVAPLPPNPGPPIPEGPMVQRDASITVEVKRDGFSSAYQSLLNLVHDEGGYQSQSNMQADNGPLRSGSISFRVPATALDDTLHRIGSMGTVKALSVNGNDVSQEYVDLQARLRSAQAEESAYLQLLTRATAVADILQVDQQLGQVRSEIEQIQGRINYLNTTTTYATVSVTVTEAGAASGVAGDDWGFRTALSDAAHGFVHTVNLMIVGAGELGPVLLVVLGLAILFWRRRGPVGLPAAA
ncbi:MAG: DUF4349 domain-containing protein [Candidatus Dormibacteria bacterium]